MFRMLSIAFAGALLFPHAAVAQSCDVQSSWSVGRIGHVFGISEYEVRQAALRATALWESATNKELFYYDPTSEFKVKLVDDGSHQLLQKVIHGHQQTGRSKAAIDRKKQEIDSLKRQHESGVRQYQQRAQQLEAFIGKLNEATRAQRLSIEEYGRKRDKAMTEKAHLKQMQANLNQLLARINGEVDNLNKMVDGHNRYVSRAPELSESRAGRYTYERKSSAFGRARTSEKIEVYRFVNIRHLTWILAHEFGHALGLGHVNQPGSIMSRSNDSGEISKKSPQLTAADLSILSKNCS